MAAGSSSNAQPKYDVFLSFSGEDTRKGFTNTLYYVLKGKGIDTFIDDDLSRGEQIEASLMRTIEESVIAVVVFSNKYASSSWCLDELLKIAECSQVVLPIFYNVNPSHVHEQNGKFGDEFTKLKRTESKTKIKKWSDALSFVATQSGWDLANYRIEIDLINEVATCILKKLDSASLLSASPSRFIGIASRIGDIQKLLNNESSSVQFLGVWGMGGLGKSTVVNVLYHKLSKQFDACYFVANIRHESSSRLVTIRNEIISKILKQNFSDGTLDIGPSVILRLQKKKVLIVLDDVSTSDQVTTLVGTKIDNWFGSGSKVIITSRDLDVFKLEDMTVFEIEKMSPENSLRLFCLKAFKQNQPLKGYEELSQQIVNCAKGVPLALNVLGSSLYGREINEWVSKLEKLRTSLDMKIEEVLKISYYDLDREEKIIFLDIACFFKGDYKDKVKNILDGCGLFATIGITRLIEKCLITLSEDERLGMHDLLQKMGWEIARQEVSQEFGMRSRFWTPNDSYNVLTSFSVLQKIGWEIAGQHSTPEFGMRSRFRTPKDSYNMLRNHPNAGAVEGIFLDMDKIEKLNISPMTFSEMRNLRLLKLEQSSFSFDGFHESKISMCGNIEFLPNSLRFLHWDGYPFESLPSNFYAENIVELILHNSKMIQLWDSVKFAQHSAKQENLKVLDLQGSECLTELPDLSSAANLEKIILDDCVGLIEIPISIQHLQCLSILSLRACTNISSLPCLVNLKSLKILDLYGCSTLKKFPETSGDIEVLNLEKTAVVDWPQSMSYLNELKALYLTPNLQSLPSTMYLNSLKTFTLTRSKIMAFPTVIGGIEKLNLDCIKITELPPSIVLLDSLVELTLRSCEKLERLPENYSQMTCLEKLDLSYCSKLFSRPFTLSGLYSIKELSLQGCKLRNIPGWLGTLSSLRELNLSWNDFYSIRENIKQLTLLEVLNLRYCKSLQSLPELPCHLNKLDLCGCESLKRVSRSLFPTWGQRIPRTDNFELSSNWFCFLDCSRLGPIERRNIVTDAQMRIQHMANDRNESVRFPLTVSLAENEIPDSFCQSKGSSVNMTLPTNWCNHMFVGFIFCFIVKDYRVFPLTFYQSWTMTYDCNFKSKDESDLGSCSVSFHIEEGSSIKSSALILHYSGDIYSPGKGNQFSRENHKDATHAIFRFTSNPFNVLSCGVRLVYAEIEEQNNLNTVKTNSVDTERKRDSVKETESVVGKKKKFMKFPNKLARCFRIPSIRVREMC